MVMNFFVREFMEQQALESQTLKSPLQTKLCPPKKKGSKCASGGHLESGRRRGWRGSGAGRGRVSPRRRTPGAAWCPRLPSLAWAPRPQSINFVSWCPSQEASRFRNRLSSVLQRNCCCFRSFGTTTTALIPRSLSYQYSVHTAAPVTVFKGVARRPTVLGAQASVVSRLWLMLELHSRDYYS